ncbi:hypothetical protein NB696_002191 [Xanthomonas sacchari]|uniref:hypothetical protein n=1 Tax=Xanthomonas TaxID=338 RepID=UPI0022542A2D|nr:MULTISPECIES: hypothetical protein [Xanthomonas]MCW0393509.1 hypothetical protein [Xanthomonas sacchari]MCW0445319.1 hypothetical protein [Xanthomonas sacchari]MDY4295873.1 hypothetical protein [Xanthomonas sp. LF02-5]MDY4357668.1 hypothetical protein [Xanthomonas sp. LF04-12]UYK76900.1 hypothetical protein NG825_00350 [Xanthomonas sacchari]
MHRDGELQPDLQARRDAIAPHRSAELRADRQDLTPLAKPQQGVHLLREAFPSATPIPGAVDAGTGER